MPQTQTITTTIAAGQPLSDAIDCTLGNAAVAITFPADWTSSGGITFQMSVDNVDYFDVYKSDGKDLIMAVKPGGCIIVDPVVARAMRYVKIRSGTPQKPISQPADRTFQIVLAP